MTSENSWPWQSTKDEPPVVTGNPDYMLLQMSKRLFVVIKRRPNPARSNLCWTSGGVLGKDREMFELNSAEVVTRKLSRTDAVRALAFLAFGKSLPADCRPIEPW